MRPRLARFSGGHRTRRQFEKLRCASNTGRCRWVIQNSQLIEHRGLIPKKMLAGMGSTFRAIGQSPRRNALVSEIRRDCKGFHRCAQGAYPSGRRHKLSVSGFGRLRSCAAAVLEWYSRRARSDWALGQDPGQNLWQKVRKEVAVPLQAGEPRRRAETTRPSWRAGIASDCLRARRASPRLIYQRTCGCFRSVVRRKRPLMTYLSRLMRADFYLFRQSARSI